MGRVVFYTIISPVNASSESGGGNRTGRIIIDHIKNCGYDVQICTPETEWINPCNSIFNVAHDIFNDPGASKWFSEEEYCKIFGDAPYLYSDCGYSSLTVKPYGMNGKRYDYSADLSKYTRRFIIEAEKFICGSPLHLDECEKHIGQKINNAFVYPREVDYEKFTNKNLERDIEYLHIGSINWWKGSDIVHQFYGDDALIFGHGSPLGVIRHDKLPELYNRAKNFVHLPRWKEPFGRTVAEAALCGCNLITNENVGCCSYEKDLSDPNFYIQAGKDFEEMIYECF